MYFGFIIWIFSNIYRIVLHLFEYRTYLFLAIIGTILTEPPRLTWDGLSLGTSDTDASFTSYLQTLYFSFQQRLTVKFLGKSDEEEKRGDGVIKIQSGRELHC